MSETTKLYLGFGFGFVSLLVILAAIYYIFIFFMRFFSPSFYCNATVIGKEPEMRSSPGSKGTCAYYNVYTVTIELTDQQTMRYAVPLETYVALEVGEQYRFFIEANDIMEYSPIESLV